MRECTSEPSSRHGGFVWFRGANAFKDWGGCGGHGGRSGTPTNLSRNGGFGPGWGLSRKGWGEMEGGMCGPMADDH